MHSYITQCNKPIWCTVTLHNVINDNVRHYKVNKTLHCIILSVKHWCIACCVVCISLLAVCGVFVSLVWVYIRYILWFCRICIVYSAVGISAVCCRCINA